jgi:hypothetical protein
MSPKSGFDLADYVDVPARMAWFFERYPQGSLQSEVLIWPVDGLSIIVVKAYAHRAPDDEQPGQGLASEVYPGTTPYTKGSELMNAETSAWGRALAAIGAPTKGHVASAEEVEGAATRRVTSAKGWTPKATTPQAETTVAEAPDVGPGEGTDQGKQEPSPPTLPADHQHTWVQSPTLKKFVVCSDPACRKVVKKEDVDVA